MHGVNLHACGSAVVDLGHHCHDLTWVFLELTPVDILPKPTASTRPWRVYHLQACHGPPGAQLHLQASREIRGPGKPLGAPPGHLWRSRPGLSPLGSTLGRARWGTNSHQVPSPDLLIGQENPHGCKWLLTQPATLLFLT